MKWLARVVAFALLAGCLPLAANGADRLICCGAAEVFILPADAKEPKVDDRLWRWQAKDSPEIPESMHRQFVTTDDCKPYGDRILITSSSGGVALVRRDDKKCLFYTSARNAHSAALVPGERVVVAASTGGDELLLFDLGKSGEKLEPLARTPLVGAHGALWDAGRKRLWALGTHELLLVDVRENDGKTELAVDKRWNLPTPGGHDLSPTRDGNLFITSNTAVYRFDTTAEKFEPFKPLAESIAIKSIDEHPTTGAIVYHQADHGQKVWWSDAIRFLEPERTLRVPGERLYKVRWDVERK